MATSARRLLAFTVLLGALCGVHLSCIAARSMAPMSDCKVGAHDLAGSANIHVGLPASKVGAHDLANGAVATTGRSALAWVVAGALVGLTSICAAVASANRQQARTAARVALGAPSLIQVLEQKNLLSLVEKSGLLSKAEKKKLLSFVEQNGLLTLAASLVNKPLTLTEKLGVLSTLESKGLLSAVESSATDKYGPAILRVGVTILFSPEPPRSKSIEVV